jgi:hypothetical protein
MMCSWRSLSDRPSASGGSYPTVVPASIGARRPLRRPATINDRASTDGTARDAPARRHRKVCSDGCAAARERTERRNRDGLAAVEVAEMRALGVSVAIAVIVLLATAGHVLFLPLLIVPFGFLATGRRKGNRPRRF